MIIEIELWKWIIFALVGVGIVLNWISYIKDRNGGKS